MKKVLAFLLTAIFAVTALTAAAETPSPEKIGGVIVSVSGQDADGSALKLAVESTETQQTAYYEALDNLKSEVGDPNLKIVDHKQLVLKEGKNPKFPLTVDLNVPGIKPTSKVFVLFKPESNQATGLSDTAADGEVIGLSVSVNFRRVINLAETGAEIQKLKATAGKDKVTVTFNALGEFVLVTDVQTLSDINSASSTDTSTNDTSAPSASTDGSDKKEENKSPQTADAISTVMVALLAVGAVAAVVSVKKIKAAE